MNITINKDQCNKTGKNLLNIEIKKDFLNRAYINNDYSEQLHLNALYFSVAICHQTYKLAHIEKGIYGWDVFEYVTLKMMEENSSLLNPDFVVNISHSELQLELKKAFSETENPEDCTLDDIENRAKLYKKAAMLLANLCRPILDQIKEASDIETIYKLLAKTDAFSDPYRKKSSLLIKFLFDTKIIDSKDFDSLETYVPIMDYHMQRVLMRLGCIEISDEELKTALINRIPQESDIEIREACIEAMYLIAKDSGHPIWSMNDYFWTLGRSCCEETPLCVSNKCAKNPCSFEEVTELINHKHCIFEDHCNGAKDENYRNLWQPIVKTHFY